MTKSTAELQRLIVELKDEVSHLKKETTSNGLVAKTLEMKITDSFLNYIADGANKGGSCNMREEEELSTRTDEILESLRADSTDIIATEQDKEMNVDAHKV